jgi:hypothetical protein
MEESFPSPKRLLNFSGLGHVISKRIIIYIQSTDTKVEKGTHIHHDVLISTISSLQKNKGRLR